MEGAQMEIESMLKSDELREIVREMVHEQLGHTFEDMEEIRRSPAGAVIRIEEEIKLIKKQISSIEQNIATKNELKLLETKLDSKIDSLKEEFNGFKKEFNGLKGIVNRLEGRFDGVESRMKLLTAPMFVLITLFGTFLAKLIIFP